MLFHRIKLYYTPEFHIDTPNYDGFYKVDMVPFWVSMLNFRAIPFPRHNFMGPDPFPQLTASPISTGFVEKNLVSNS